MEKSALLELDIGALSALLRRRELTSEEVTRACLERIEATDAIVNSFVSLCPDRALAAAREADGRLAAGNGVTPLTGVPIALKDVIVTRGVLTTAGSKILGNFIPPYDATVTERLEESGAVILGKLNCDEFAMGSSTENSAFGPSRNPWDVERVAGGSSGGSATAVAARQCFGSLGTDTGGSIRLPASFCGVAGMKPTYGRVSRYGIVAYASSLDQVGPLGKTVRDCALLLEAVAGFDARDSTSIADPVPPYAERLEEGVEGLRIGVPKEYFPPGIEPEVEGAVRNAIAELGDLGAEILDVSLPHTEYAIACYYLIATAEASSNLARYDGIRYGVRTGGAADMAEMYCQTRSQGFGREVKRRIMLGTYALSAGYYDAYYLKAQKARTLIRADFAKAFEKCEVIACAVSPTTAFRIGEKTSDPVKMYLSDVFTTSANLAGLPALSVPCGFDARGLPIGLQLIGRPLAEETLLRAARAYERGRHEAVAHRPAALEKALEEG